MDSDQSSSLSLNITFPYAYPSTFGGSATFWSAWAPTNISWNFWAWWGNLTIALCQWSSSRKREEAALRRISTTSNYRLLPPFSSWVSSVLAWWLTADQIKMSQVASALQFCRSCIIYVSDGIQFSCVFSPSTRGSNSTPWCQSSEDTSDSSITVTDGDSNYFYRAMFSWMSILTTPGTLSLY